MSTLEKIIFKQKQEKQIEDLIKLFDDWCPEVDVESNLYGYEIGEDINNSDDLCEIIQDSGGFEIDIIYYSEAMKYLSENDASLSESVGIASDMGYSTVLLNSELLASLHASQKVREDFYSIKDDIDEILSR
tara:strand:+ start:226 stop:621 length:396 start_codon:yes stop_codon:yes gene_type:complete